MKQYNLCFLGFGNVGRALARLLVAKSAELRGLYGVGFRVTGVASRRIGWLSNAVGFDVATLLSNAPLAEHSSSANSISEWLREAQPDAVFDTTSLNPDSGQPAIEYLRSVLESGAHAITANKGALVYGYHELADLARMKG
jgi:homoserine dehydrogenase